jgi:RNA polymerase I specific transcription initiation factor RRN3
MISAISVLEAAATSPRASLKRKRDEAGKPDSPHKREPLTPTSMKRSKATDIPAFSQIKTQAWVDQTTLKALEEHARGRDALYQNLRAKFTVEKVRRADAYEEDGGETTNEELKQWILAMTKHAHVMGREAGGLLSAMLHCRWLERDEECVKGMQQFLISLLSCHGGYVPHVVKWLVGRFANGMTFEF